VDRVDQALVDIVGVYAVREGDDEICMRLVPLITRCTIGQEITIFTSQTSAAGLRRGRKADE